jgi:hypothetical protein
MYMEKAVQKMVASSQEQVTKEQSMRADATTLLGDTTLPGNRNREAS